MMKDIPGYNGDYKINESGVVINKKNHAMRTAVSHKGYLRTALQDREGNRYNKSIHRLVAETFIPNPDNLPIVMHLDNDKLNNHVSNLKWGTQEDNMKQIYDDGIKLRNMVKYKYTKNNSNNHYQVYNEKLGDYIYCDSRRDVAELIMYAEISLKNIVGHERGITQGPYKGYKIRRLVDMVHYVNKPRK